MMLIECPFCGPRDETEFSCGGEAHIARPLAENKISDADFADYLFMRDNPKGLFLERWRHSAGCRRWFNMARDTVSHDVVEVYPMGALPKTAAAKSARELPAARQPVKVAANNPLKARVARWREAGAEVGRGDRWPADRPAPGI